MVDINKSQRHIHSDGWEFVDEDTTYLTHNIHRYSGKFIPQIAGKVIELLTNKGDTVLDFYCGSGTTLLESMIRGRKSVGIDLNPLAVLISKVKTTPIKKSTISAGLNILHKNMDGYSQQSLLSNDEKFEDEWFKKWFSKQILSSLCFVHQELMNLSDEHFKNATLVAFSDIVRRVSNAHSGYPNVMFDKHKIVNLDVITVFFKKLDNVLASISELSDLKMFKSTRPKIIFDSAEAMPLQNCSIDAIVTHPPYAASIPYAEYGALSLKWMGHSPQQLDKCLTGGKRQSSDFLKRFKASYHAAVSEAYRVLKRDGNMFLMVGNPTVKGEIFDLHQFSMDVCKTIGFSLTEIASRSGQNRRANKMGKEYLLFFKKR